MAFSAAARLFAAVEGSGARRFLGLAVCWSLLCVAQALSPASSAAGAGVFAALSASLAAALAASVADSAAAAISAASASALGLRGLGGGGDLRDRGVGGGDRGSVRVHERGPAGDGLCARHRQVSAQQLRRRFADHLELQESSSGRSFPHTVQALKSWSP